MTTSVGSPTVRRRRLGRELRRLREARGLSIDDVARTLEMSPATVQRYETERGAVKVTYVRTLVDHYQTENPLREVLLEIARKSRQKGWWAAYGDVMRPDFEEYVGLEAEAASIRAYGTHLVHGLLQTENYARALLSAVRKTDTAESIDRLVELRTQRQGILDRTWPRFSLWMVMDEAVLRRPVGGPDVLREQVLALRAAADRPNVTLQVMPFARGAHTGLNGAFSIIEFPHQADPDVGYIDGPAGNLYVEKDADVRWFTLVFDHMRAEALPPDESTRYLGSLAKDLAR